MWNSQEIFPQDSIRWVSLDVTMRAIQPTANMKVKEELPSLPELT